MGHGYAPKGALRTPGAEFAHKFASATEYFYLGSHTLVLLRGGGERRVEGTRHSGAEP